MAVEYFTELEHGVSLVSKMRREGGNTCGEERGGRSFTWSPAQVDDSWKKGCHIWPPIQPDLHQNGNKSGTF